MTISNTDFNHYPYIDKIRKDHSVQGHLIGNTHYSVEAIDENNNLIARGFKTSMKEAWDEMIQQYEKVVK